MYHIEDIINQNAILYANKNKTLKLFSDIGLQLPERLNNLGFDTIIHQSNNIVNTSIRDEKKNDTSFDKPMSVSRKVRAEDAVAKKGSMSEGVKGGIKNSIETLSDGRKYVRADRQVISGDNPTVWAEQVETYINEKIRQGQDVTVYTDDGDAVLLTDRTAGKITYYNQNLPTDNEYASKLRAATHIDELAKISRLDNRPIEPDRDGRHGEFAKGGWQYRTAYFVDRDGRYYKIGMSTALNDQGKVVYNIGSIRERSNPVRGSSAQKGGAQSGIASTTRIPQKNSVVKNNIRQSGENDTSFDKPMSVSRKQRGAEETLDSDSGSVVELTNRIYRKVVLKMSIRTPKHWEKEERVETTTAYGNKVMVPKRLIKGWQGLKSLQELALREGADLSIGVEDYNHTTSVRHERRNALMVFYEKYQREE